MPIRGSAKGLRTAAQKKKELASERTKKAIDEMVASDKTINFHTVALAANVSVAYLYKNDELKQRIDQLRKKQSPIKGLQKQGKSDNSQKAVITTLVRIQVGGS